MQTLNRILKYAVIIVLAVALSLGAAHAGPFTTLKLAHGERGWEVKYNQVIDGLNSLWDQTAALAAQVLGFVTTEDQLVYITAAPTYVDGNTFTVPGDVTAKLAVNKVVLLDLGADGVKFNTVAAASFGGGVTTVDLSTSNLTNNLTRVAVFATRTGLFPWGDGRVFSRDYGVPSQSTLQAAVAFIGPLERELTLYPGDWTISAKQTIPANVLLKPVRGALLTVAIPDVAIAGLSRAAACVVTWTGHGLADGDVIYISGITQTGGWTALNRHHLITKINDDSFSIPVNTSGYTADYNPGTDPGIYSQTLYIQSFEGGLWQYFDGAVGKVAFRPGAAKELYSEWWGAKPDNSTDCASAFSTWLTACIDSGIKGELASGIYKILSGVAATMAADKSLTLSGQGGGTIIDVSGVPYLTGFGNPEVHAIRITGTTSTDPNNVIRLSDFWIKGGATDLGSLNGLYLDTVGQSNLRGVIATNLPAIGIRGNNVGYVELDGCNCSFNYYAGAIFSGDIDTPKARGIRVIGGEYNSNGNGSGPWYPPLPPVQYYGIGYGLVADMQQVYIAGIRAVNNDRYGVDCRGGRDIELVNPYIYNSGLKGFYCPNYDIAPRGGVRVKVIGGIIDNADRAGNMHCIDMGPQTPSSGSAVPVEQILLSGVTIKGALQQAIAIGSEKLASGETSLKKLIIEGCQINNTTQTGTYSQNAIFAGAFNSTAASYIDSVTIKDNQIANGGIYVGASGNANISGNQIYLTGSEAMYKARVIYSSSENTIINNNTVKSPLLTWTINPFFYDPGGGQYTGLSKIREMKGNVVNGAHPATLWDWIYNNSELSFKYAANTVGSADRLCLEMIFSGTTKKTAAIQALYSMIGGTDASPINVTGEINEGIMVDNAGAVTFAGASPYSITPVKETVLGAGPPSMTWKLMSGVNTIDLYMNPNTDSLIEAEIKVRYSGTIATMIVRDPVGGADYIQ